MSKLSKQSAIEKRAERYTNRQNVDFNFDDAFVGLALSVDVTQEQIVAATNILTEDFSSRVDARTRREGDSRRLYYVSKYLSGIARHPKFLAKMPQGFGLFIADQMSTNLANEKLKDEDAGVIYNSIKSIIYDNAFMEETNSEHVASSLCKLSAASISRPYHYLDVAELAVSDKFLLTHASNIERVVNAYASRANPIQVKDASDMHVRAMQIFAANNDEIFSSKEHVPALYNALENFDDIIASIGYDIDSDEQTSAKRSGLIAGHHAIMELVVYN